MEFRMPGTIINHTLLRRYETLVKELYTYPKNEEILERFSTPRLSQMFVWMKVIIIIKQDE